MRPRYAAWGLGALACALLLALPALADDAAAPAAAAATANEVADPKLAAEQWKSALVLADRTLA